MVQTTDSMVQKTDTMVPITDSMVQTTDTMIPIPDSIVETTDMQTSCHVQMHLDLSQLVSTEQNCCITDIKVMSQGTTLPALETLQSQVVVPVMETDTTMPTSTTGVGASVLERADSALERESVVAWLEVNGAKQTSISECATREAAGQVYQVGCDGFITVRWADETESRCYPQELYLIGDEVITISHFYPI